MKLATSGSRGELSSQEDYRFINVSTLTFRYAGICASPCSELLWSGQRYTFIYTMAARLHLGLATALSAPLQFRTVLFRQRAEHLTQFLSQLHVQRSATLRDEHDVIYAFPISCGLNSANRTWGFSL